MVEHADGRRLLLADTPGLGRFVADTYAFDAVRVTPVTVRREGFEWTVTAPPLDLRFTVGGRGALGWLLHAVPSPLARNRRWVRLVDLPARLAQPGVRTYGSAGHGRREWYGARDLRRITAATTSWDGADLGHLTDVDPPVRFGFGSTPRTPALVRVTTTVALPVCDGSPPPGRS
jgi:hypothetical protein